MIVPPRHDQGILARFRNERIPGVGRLGRRARWSLAFLVISLGLLFVVPILTQRRFDRALDEIEEVAQPAAHFNRVFQVQLARESSWLLLFQVTENERYREAFVRTVREERRALADLARLADDLGPDVEARVAELRRRHAIWLETVDTADFLERGQDPVVFLQRFTELQDRYAATAAVARQVAEAIQAAITERREALEAAARVRTVATIVLAVLAFVAVAVVVRIGGRLARLAADIERRRRDEESARRELERVTERRSRLMRGFSHDLKNPLGAADGQAALLAEETFGELNAEQRESVGRIRGSIVVALELIESVLELARLEAGVIEVERVEIDMPGLIREVAEAHRAEIDTHGLTLETRLPDSFPPVRSDPARIRQVLDNVIGNAVGYTPPGGRITIGLAIREDARAPAPGQWAAVDVQDTGPGITPEDQPRIFEEFTRLGSTRRGAGLGLAISRSVARMLGGDLTIESEVGRGSIFTLWLPLDAAG